MITLTSDHELGPVLRSLRHHAGLSLEQLAKRCHITKGGLSNREIRPRAMTAGALIETAGALGYDVVLVPRRPAVVTVAAGHPHTSQEPNRHPRRNHMSTEPMAREEYDRWWARIDDETITHSLPEPERTLALHVLALQDRIDQLLEPDEHDRSHGRGCRCYLTQCACAYDHPDAVCMVHEPPRADAGHQAHTPGDSQ